MYYNFTVQIPSIKGKVLTKDKGAATYILYQYGLDYKPDKKYAIPKRTIIGKVDPADRFQRTDHGCIQTRSSRNTFLK